MAIEDVIHFHSGLQRGSSYFFIGDDDKPHRDARVTLKSITIAKEKLVLRDRIKRPVLDMSEFLVDYLPEVFADQIRRAGHSDVEAWNYMAGMTNEPAIKSSRSKTLDRRNRIQTERLARIIASVDGGEKTPNVLIEELMALISEYLPEALSLLAEWKDTFGYSAKGGYIIVGNRANRKAKNGSTKASSKAA